MMEGESLVEPHYLADPLPCFVSRWYAALSVAFQADIHTRPLTPSLPALPLSHAA
jgi:hypothetical protein